MSKHVYAAAPSLAVAAPEAPAAVTLLVSLPSAGVTVEVLDSEGAPCTRDGVDLR